MIFIIIFKSLFLRRIIYLFLIAFIVLGCDKKSEGNISDVGSESGGTVISVSILGIEEDLVALRTGGNKLLGATNSNYSEIISFDEGFDARYSVGEFEAVSISDVFVTNIIDQGDEVTLKGAKMDDGMYFHLLLYKESDNVIVYNGQLKSGEELKITVDAGVNYKWIAYSYNSSVSADLPAPVFTTPSVISTATVPMGVSRDFLYTSGSIVPTAWVNTPLGVFFKRKTARIAVELNSMGMFGDINAANVSISNQLKTGTFNLISGNITGALTTVGTASASSFTRVAGYGYDDRKVGYFYTVDPTLLTNLTVRLNSLTLALDSYAVSQGQSTRDFTALSTTFNSPNFTPVIGKSKMFKIDLIESPVTTSALASLLSTGITNCCAIETKWARANLYYIGDGAHNPYRFHHLNQPTNDLNTYFSIGSAKPRQFAVSTSLADPCELVYPNNVWRTANSYDYASLAGGGASNILYGYPAKSRVNSVTSFSEYAVTNSAVPQYPYNALRFNYNGSGVAVSLVLGLVNLNLLNMTSTASLWSSSKTIDLGLLSLGHNYYSASSSTHSVSSELLTLDLLESINILNSGFRNIRCVRK